MTTSRRPHIALLAAPATSPSVLFGLYDVLQSVGPMWADMTAAEPAEALLDVSIVAASREPFRCFGNILVEPRTSLDEMGEVDAVIVCDMYTPIDEAPRDGFNEEIESLRRLHAEGTLLASVCSGSLLLAEADLLGGRSCAGHWAYRDLFQAEYPSVRYQPRAILDLTSEHDGLITAGGVTAWQELALHLIARFCGPDHATRTAKVFLLAGHEDGQLPFSAMDRRIRTDDAVIRGCLDWIADNYAIPNPVTAMIDRSGLTRRTFSRRFRAATGHRPIDYVQALRIEWARNLLESGSDAVDDIGYTVGYEDPTFFRRLFKRTTGLTPAAYRRKFASIGRVDVGRIAMVPAGMSSVGLVPAG
jgi:transcriptional regulator GlxA family with amidase domain